MPERFKFSKTKLQVLPTPEAGRSTYYDETVPKLALRITATGTKTFYVIKRSGSEMVWLKLGVFPDMTVERAREDAEKALGQFSADSNPADVRRARRKEMTLGDFFDQQFKPKHLDKTRSTLRRTGVFNHHIRPTLGNLKLSDLDNGKVSRLLSELDGKGYAGQTVNHVRNLLSSMYERAIEWGVIANNPVKGIKSRRTNSRDRFLQPKELPRFFEALAAEDNDSVRDYLLISLLTGARQTNVLEMKWQELNLDEGIWTIPRTKNDDPQNVTLSPEAVEILTARKGCHATYVFTGRSKAGNMTQPQTGWKRVIDRDEIEQIRKRIQDAGKDFEWPRAGETVKRALDRARKTATELDIDTSDARLPNIRIHDLRRTLGSWQARTGASLVIIGKSLNHKSPSATAVYARLDLDPVRNSVNTATTAMFEAGQTTFRKD